MAVQTERGGERTERAMLSDAFHVESVHRNCHPSIHPNKTFPPCEPPLPLPLSQYPTNAHAVKVVEKNIHTKL